MAHSAHYRIDYLLNGAYKTLVVSSPKMDSADAWHWAAVDAGFAQIPKYRSDKIPKLTKPQVERHGIENVQWSAA